MRSIIPIIRQWWYRSRPVPKDEFDISLSLDVEYIMDIEKKVSYYEGKVREWKKVRREYEYDLGNRRSFAHERDMREMDAGKYDKGR